MLLKEPWWIASAEYHTQNVAVHYHWSALHFKTEIQYNISIVELILCQHIE